MGNLFSHSSTGTKSKQKGPVITDTDRAVLSLKTQRRKLEDQATLIAKRIDHNVEVAKELIQQKRRDRALLALKKKKINEQQLEAIHKWLVNVEDMLASIEVTKQQQRVFEALKDGNEQLKRMQQEFSVEDVQQLLDDTAEAKAVQEEMQQLLGASLTDQDNDVVEEELEELERAQLAAEVAAMPVPPEVPPEQAAAAAEAAAKAAGESAAAAKTAEVQRLAAELPSVPKIPEPAVQEALREQQQDAGRGTQAEPLPAS